MWALTATTTCAGLPPSKEVDLCGHATLAAAHVVFAGDPALSALRQRPPA